MRETDAAGEVAAPARVIGVLGMHRSGTSFLTGSLQEAGLFLGEHHTWNLHNTRGNRENQGIVDLHDAILADNGGSWDNPPRRVRWSGEHKDRARALLAAHASEAVFGFKDPRALLVLDGWKQLVPRIEFVGIFRHPNAVAESLGRRDGKSREECLGLWCTYNRILLRESRARGFPLFNFDESEAELHRKIDRVVRELGLNGRSGEERFYSDELRRSSAEGERLPWRVGRLHRKLCRQGLRTTC